MWRLNFRQWILTYQLRDKLVGEEAKRYGVWRITKIRNSPIIITNAKYPWNVKQRHRAQSGSGPGGDSECFFLKGFPTGMFTRRKNCLFHSLKRYAKLFEDLGKAFRSLVRGMAVPGCNVLTASNEEAA